MITINRETAAATVLKEKLSDAEYSPGFEVEFDPVGAVFGDDAVEGSKRPVPPRFTGQTNVAAGGVVAACHDGRVGKAGFGADAERFDFAPQPESHALGMHIIGQSADAAGEAGGVDDVPVAAIVVPVRARV